MEIKGSVQFANAKNKINFEAILKFPPIWLIGKIIEAAFKQ
jgi:hypothetical protein